MPDYKYALIYKVTAYKEIKIYYKALKCFNEVISIKPLYILDFIKNIFHLKKKILLCIIEYIIQSIEYIL